mmetsp:Transcript_3863/g.9726  ORF Transcript_3863/g.9726 Transcript_3863/m.9726 type:complete len:629 (-) Transcript_3863:792-2678(-)
MKTTRTNNSRKRVGVAAAVVVIATTLINCVVVADAHDDASSAIARVCEARDAGTQEAMRTYRLSVSGRRKEMPEGCINNKAQESSCTAPSQFHIVTQTSKEIADYAIIATSINAAYADQHGYGFESVDELTLDQDKFDHRYEKVRILRHKLDELCPAMARYVTGSTLSRSKKLPTATSLGCPEWLVWIDADATVVDFSQRFEDIIGEDDDNIHLHACRDTATDVQQAINSGVMILRNSLWTRQFLDTWWAAAEGAVDEIHGMPVKITDEEAFQRMYTENVGDLRQHSRIHSEFVFNTPYPYFTIPDKEASKQFIFHPLVTIPYVRTKLFTHVLDSMCGAAERSSESSPSLGNPKAEPLPHVVMTSPQLVNMTATWIKEWAEMVLKFDGDALGDVPLVSELEENNHLAHVASTGTKNIANGLSQMWMTEARRRAKSEAEMAAFDFTPEQRKLLHYFQALSMRIARSNWSDPQAPGGCQSCRTVCLDSSKVLGELYEAFYDDGGQLPSQWLEGAVDAPAGNLAYSLALYRTALECDPGNSGAARRYVRVFEELLQAGLDIDGSKLDGTPGLDMVYVRAVASSTAAEAATIAARQAVSEMLSQSGGAHSAAGAGGLGERNPKFIGHDDVSW